MSDKTSRGPDGLVADVLNDRQLVINRGSDDGVRVGAKYEIFDPEAHEPKDPETGESLGPIYVFKIRVKVIRVEPRYCVAETYDKVLVPGKTGSLQAWGGSSIAALMGQPDREVYVTLDDYPWRPLKHAGLVKPFVNVGDLARPLKSGTDKS